MSRSAPSIEQKLNTTNYKNYRTRLDLYHRQVKRKGKEALLDGAFLRASLLQPHHPDLVENLDFDAMEACADGIAYITALLDKSFKYGQEVELPIRCEDFFHRFARQKSEPMQQYVLRHSTERRKLKEAGIDIPDALAGWHLFSRSAIPPWTEVQVKTMCFGDLQVDKVTEALLKIFGPDHVPNAKDLTRVARPGPLTKGVEEGMYADHYEEFVEDLYLEDDGYGYYDDPYDYDYYDYDEGYYGEEESYYVGDGYEEYEYDEEDVPEDLNHAYDQTEEAYLGYLDARKKMRELANNRGFYPVMAVMPDFFDAPRERYSAPRPSKGKGKGKGKGSGKSARSGKGRGKSFAKGKG